MSYNSLKITYKVLLALITMLPANGLFAQFSFSKNTSKREFQPVQEAGLLLALNQQRSDINNLYIIDLSSVNVGAGLYYRYTYHYFLANEITATYYRIEGADRYVRDKAPYSNGWFRYVRNLSYRTDVIEIAIHQDVHMKKFQPFITEGYRWTPYISGGVGFVWFNPKAELDGRWYALQPLGTEGQGRAGYGAKYSRLTWAAPIRAGFKVNLTEHASFQWFAGYTFVGTDYLDDVSTVYADPADLDVLTADIAMRADEVVSPEVYGRITAPGEQRGDPGDKDGFWVMGTTLSFKVTKKPPRIPCMRW
jgi:hypothetical protein